MSEQVEATEAASPAEVALLRSLALAAGEAAAAGAALPEPLQAAVETWLRADWLAGAPADADRSFAQGYLAALEVAARHCEQATGQRAAMRRRSWNPLRRHRLRLGERALLAMAETLRRMAAGVRPFGG
ncbi:hypothetical protein JMJ55_11225 [Belnapia sp. T6]|uniref:Uncharacterized protein n=1 Tax=Belnapia mucosa TaxID=2804532 RepID=A0ABS1V2H1_9PROT|nr:hypothetical protein [Belnapia mucosa]MBL6455896.1 hypothetical protein [Belnapia mucosa]